MKEGSDRLHIFYAEVHIDGVPYKLNKDMADVCSIWRGGYYLRAGEPGYKERVWVPGYKERVRVPEEDRYKPYRVTIKGLDINEWKEKNNG